MRSKLFVPGSRPELFAKAYAGPADAISLDLEDAVASSRKADARGQVCNWLDRLAQDAGLAAGKTTIVRVNSQDTPYFAEDLEAIIRPGLDMINLPKPADAGSVADICEQIGRLERQRGMDAPVRVLLNIEMPRALRTAAALAQAHARVAGLQLGLGDLFEPAAIDRRERDAIGQVLFLVRMAASEAGIDAYDGAFANIQDTDGFQEEARLAQRLGFQGKTCIHPAQVALANAVFQPSRAQVADARKVVAAAAQAQAAGLGVCVVDGRMIDAPFIARAHAILAAARPHDSSLSEDL